MRISLNQLSYKLRKVTGHPLYIKFNFLLIPLLSILIAALVVVFLTIPQSYNLIDTGKQITEIQQKKPSYREKLTALEQINLDEQKLWLENVLYILPSEKDIPNAIASVLQLLTSSGLQLDNISLGSPNTDGGSSSFAVNLEVSGNIDQLKSLIDLANQSSRLIKIAGLSTDSSTQGDLHGSLDLLVFYAPLDTNVSTTADQKITPISSEDKKLLSQIETRIQQIKGSTETTITDSPSGRDDPFN